MLHRAQSIAGALTLALLAAACSDGPISPAASPGALRNALTRASGQPSLIPSHIKYSDQGAKPATGRSGGATLTAYALQGKEGVTELVVTAGTTAAAAQAVTLSKVQVKQFTTSGDLLRTVNDNRRSGGASATYAYAGLSRGAALQVQGNVGTGARTGVVTVRETIHLRPDLRAALSAPAASLVGTPVNLFATVTEANGDVGARADCVLYVDGAEADRASGIWVDAGGAVSCAFTHTFPTPGPAQVRVEVASVVPGDYDPANNSAAATIQITQPEPENSDFSYYAFAEDALLEEVSTYRALHEYVSPAQTAADTATYLKTSNIQNAMFNGWMSHGVALPLTRVELLQQTGGATVHAATYVEMTGHEFPPVGDSPDCVSRWSGRGFIFYLCTTLEYQHTSFQYLYYATQVTYVSEQHTHIWYNETGEHYFYNFQWTDGWVDGEARFEIGEDYTFSVKVTDGGHTWQTGARVVLAPDTPWTYTHYPPTGEYCDFYSDGNLTWSPCWTHQGTLTRRVVVASHYIE